MSNGSKIPIVVSVICAPQDAKAEIKLSIYLQPLLIGGQIKYWSRRDIRAGEEEAKQYQAAIDQADRVVFLLSPDLFNDEIIINVAIPSAFDQAKKMESAILPVLIRPCLLEYTPFDNLVILPRNGVPLDGMEPAEQDTCYREIAEAILRASPASAAGARAGIQPVLLKRTTPSPVQMSGLIVSPSVRFPSQLNGLLFFSLLAGVILMIVGHVFLGTQSFAIFTAGAILGLISIIPLVYLQLKLPIRARNELLRHQRTTEAIQSVSQQLIRATGTMQSLLFKHIREINQFFDKAGPLMNFLEIQRDLDRFGLTNFRNVASTITQLGNDADQLIREAEQALVKGELARLRKYAAQLRKLVDLLQSVLKA